MSTHPYWKNPATTALSLLDLSEVINEKTSLHLYPDQLVLKTGLILFCRLCLTMHFLLRILFFLIWVVAQQSSTNQHEALGQRAAL